MTSDSFRLPLAHIKHLLRRERWNQQNLVSSDHLVIFTQKVLLGKGVTTTVNHVEYSLKAKFLNPTINDGSQHKFRIMSLFGWRKNETKTKELNKKQISKDAEESQPRITRTMEKIFKSSTLGLSFLLARWSRWFFSIFLLFINDFWFFSLFVVLLQSLKFTLESVWLNAQ